MPSERQRPLHLALVYPSCHRRGGVERVVWEAAGYLAERHRVSVVCGEIDPVPEGVEVVHVPGSPFGGALAPWRFRRAAAPLMTALEADLTVSFGSDCPDATVLVMPSVHRTWVARGTSRRLGPIPVPAGARYLLPRHLVRLLLEHAAVRKVTRRPNGKLVAVSQSVADDVARWYHVPEDKVTVVPNGFNPEQCSPERTARIRDVERAPLGVAPNDVLLLFVANEYQRKGLGVLLKAMADPKIASPLLRLLLVGRVAPTAYAGEIRRLGLTQQVDWIGSVEDVGRCYAAADLFVLPTHYEPFGIVIIEALASGIPVLTTSVAGASAAVQPEVNGLLLHDPTSASELAGLLARALEPGVLATWAPLCRPSVDGYEWLSVMHMFEQVLLDVVAARGNGPTGPAAKA